MRRRAGGGPASAQVEVVFVPLQPASPGTLRAPGAAMRDGLITGWRGGRL